MNAFLETFRRKNIAINLDFAARYRRLGEYSMAKKRVMWARKERMKKWD